MPGIAAGEPVPPAQAAQTPDQLPELMGTQPPGKYDEEVDRIFGAGGPLAPAVGTFRPRQSQTEMAKAVKDPGVQERMSAQGFESVGSTADEFARYVNAEMAKYGKIIKDANIKID